MARNLYLYGGHGYEGELELFRHAHVRAQSAESANLPGLRQRFLYRVTDSDGTPATDPLITDDDIAVRRFVAAHPGAEVAIVPMVQ